jgi:hypothetical protein
MEFERDIAPLPTPPRPIPEVEPPTPRMSRAGGKSFKEALAAVESHRDKVQATLGLALIARLVGDFDFFAIARAPHLLVAELPFIGLAMLSYLIVLWFLAARTRDRWGFGMALGIGVLQATYALVLMIAAKQFAPAFIWKPMVVVLTHVALSYTAFHAGSAYPPVDSKKPWIFGFATAFIFVVLPWVAQPIMDAFGWSLT